MSRDCFRQGAFVGARPTFVLDPDGSPLYSRRVLAAAPNVTSVPADVPVELHREGGRDFMDDGLTEFWPGVNCIHCGRFVGRDGRLYFEYFEMSAQVASLDGECARCLAERAR